MAAGDCSKACFGHHPVALVNEGNHGFICVSFRAASSPALTSGRATART